MPAYDGTGPSGQGPMTGRGQGFCVLTTSTENPNQIRGLAGIGGKPIGRMNGSFSLPGNKLIDAPFGDGTGPAGMGPMTGRAGGFCAGYPVPGYMNPVVGRAGFYGAGAPAVGPYGAGSYGYGAGYGTPYAGWGRRGLGFGRGFGQGFARGWGRRRGRFGY